MHSANDKLRTVMAKASETRSRRLSSNEATRSTSSSEKKHARFIGEASLVFSGLVLFVNSVHNCVMQTDVLYLANGGSLLFVQ